MTVWYTSDLHIGHGKVAGIRWDQIFKGIPLGKPDPEELIAWHDGLLVVNWDSVVGPKDVVWILGDISSGTDKAQRTALAWLSRRPGIKHLITGNHDGAHPMHRDSHKWQRIYLGEGRPGGPKVFESVQMAAKKRVLLPKEGHVSVYLSHFPYRADRGDKVRYPEWRLANYGHILLHGHTHFTERLSWDGEAAQIHVGVDAWNMTPVDGDTVKELVWEVLGLRPDG